jgi:catechol 2,3-dioxygenase-like lactoylglutathione lyase family enzyme
MTADAVGGVIYVMLGVTDMARSVAFYEGVLGRRVVFRAGDELVFVDGGAVTIGLNAALGRLRQPVAGATELVLASDDVQGATRALAAAGVPVVRDARLATPQGQWSATVADPDGHYVTLFGQPGA